jgi:hypothetical protein
VTGSTNETKSEERKQLMQTSIILAHFGGHGAIGALGVVLLFVALAMVLLVCREEKSSKK